ncbi:hypothetical protein NMG60_11015576 [Bertholletia excelsa]
MFGELNFKEYSNSSNNLLHDESLQSPSSSLISSSFSSSSSLSCDLSFSCTTNKECVDRYNYHHHHRRHSDSFSSVNSDHILPLCTEGLGFESSDEVEDLKTDMSKECRSQEEERITNVRNDHEFMMARRQNKRNVEAFPPPITNIGKSGRRWVSFKSYRRDGRFVLKEIRIPNHDFLHASREDGRLKLQLVPSDDEAIDEGEEEDDDDGDYGCNDEINENECDEGEDNYGKEQVEGEEEKEEEDGGHENSEEPISNTIAGHS